MCNVYLQKRPLCSSLPILHTAMIGALVCSHKGQYRTPHVYKQRSCCCVILTIIFQSHGRRFQHLWGQTPWVWLWIRWTAAKRMDTRSPMHPTAPQGGDWGVGKFVVHGIHIGRENSFPLPLLGIGSETKKDIAHQLEMGLEILSTCSGVSVKELLQQVDTLLSDSVEHNKGVNIILWDIFNLEKAPGQLFCGTHTVIGFASAVNKVVRNIKRGWSWRMSFLAWW